MVKHNLLGMNIEIKYNMIQVNMVKQLEERIEFFCEDVSMSVPSLATKKLIEGSEYAEQLSENKGELFR